VHYIEFAIFYSFFLDSFNNVFLPYPEFSPLFSVVFSYIQRLFQKSFSDFLLLLFYFHV